MCLSCAWNSQPQSIAVHIGQSGEAVAKQHTGVTASMRWNLTGTSNLKKHIHRYIGHAVLAHQAPVRSMYLVQT